MQPLFEYDLDKSRANAVRHGVDFEQAQALWVAPHVIFHARQVYGEGRYLIVGKIDGRIYLAIFTYRGIAVRLISCHRADTRWKRRYERFLHETEKSQSD
jgi:hypothetical protein